MIISLITNYIYSNDNNPLCLKTLFKAASEFPLNLTNPDKTAVMGLVFFLFKSS